LAENKAQKEFLKFAIFTMGQNFEILAKKFLFGKWFSVKIDQSKRSII
jgi:hypothetical protein